MFTEDQITQIKNSSFPEIRLKKVVISDNPNDIFISVNFYIFEDYFGEKKIYRNINKDNIKIKTFLFFKSLQDEDIRNISNLEDYIKNNNLPHTDIFACTDYKGGYNAPLEQLKKDDSIVLMYSTNFSFSKNINLENLKIGFVVYHDHMDYAKNMNISIDLINTDLLFGNINEYSLIENSENVSEGVLSDIRQVKKTLRASERLNDIIQSLNLQKKMTKVLSQNVRFKEVKKYFSKSLLSTSENGYNNFIFNVDFKKISTDNFNNIPKTSDSRFESYLHELNTEISAIDILRKEYKKDFSKKQNKVNVLFPTGNEQELLISSKDGSLTNRLIDTVSVDKNTNKNKASLRELSIFNGYRTFNICDLSAYKLNNVILSYGVRLTLTDSYYSFIKLINDKLLQNLSNLKSYLSECLNPKNYDASVDAFTDSFINDIFTFKYQRPVEESILDIVSAMKIMGFLDENLKVLIDKDLSGDYDIEFAKEITSLVIPNTASQQLLSYFVFFYEKFINFINNKILLAHNGKIEIEHWFESAEEMVDTTKRPGYGYGYFSRYKEVDGILKIDTSCLKSKMSVDIKTYLNSNFILDTNEISLSPSFITCQYKKMILDTFNAETGKYETSFKNTIRDSQFIDLETEIKYYNKLDVVTDFIQPPINTIKNTHSRFLVPTPKQSLVENLSLFDNNKTLVKQNVVIPTQQVLSKKTSDQSTPPNTTNNNVMDNIRNRSDLMLSDTLSITNGQVKNKYSHLKYDINKSSVNSINEDIAPEEILLALMKLDISANKITNNEKAPFHIQALNNNKDNFFSNLPNMEQKKYLHDVSLNSKFLFLFNTICKVEYASFNSVLNAFSWRLLTSDSLTHFKNTLFLCRLSLYENSLFNIDNFKQIEMPIYDKYFILDNNSQLKQLTLRIPKIKNSQKLSKNIPTVSLKRTKLMNVLSERYSDSSSTRIGAGPAPGSIELLEELPMQSITQKNVIKLPVSTKIKNFVEKPKEVLDYNGKIIDDTFDV